MMIDILRASTTIVTALSQGATGVVPFLEVSEAAEMITWLCTRANSFTTGAVFDLSGGRATY